MTSTLARRSRPASSRRARAALAALTLTGAAAAVFALIAWLALQTAPGQRLDDRAMHIVDGAADTVRPLMRLLGGVSIGSAALVLLACVAMALARRRFTLAVGAAAIAVGANVSTQLLKNELLTRPDLGYGTLNSLPSGHTTVVFSLVLAALLVAPSALRVPVTLLGSTAATLTGAATVVAGWHRPSDVVTAMLVALAWAAATVAVLALTSASDVSAPTRRPAGVIALLGSAAAGLLLVGWGAGQADDAAELLVEVVVLGGIGVASTLAVGVFARLVDHTSG